MKVLISEKLNAINKNTKWLSDITEIPYPTLSRIVKGEDLKSIPVATFDKICTALNCGISDILSTEEDDAIKEKVKTENNKIILAERINILKSLNKIKTIVGHKYSDEYDELAHRIESLFNETSFVNGNSYLQVREDVVNEITINEILDTYKGLDINSLSTLDELNELDDPHSNQYNLFEGTGMFWKELKHVLSDMTKDAINKKLDDLQNTSNELDINHTNYNDDGIFIEHKYYVPADDKEVAITQEIP